MQTMFARKRVCGESEIEKKGKKTGGLGRGKTMRSISKSEFSGTWGKRREGGQNKKGGEQRLGKNMYLTRGGNPWGTHPK